MRIMLVLGLFGVMALAGCAAPSDAPLPSGPGHLNGLPGHWASLDGAPEFDGASGWLNTPQNASISVDDLNGRVFMVDFWTYSCVNCIRTFPHLDGLYDTYKDLGFTIIGVHSPEFEFEEDRENVQAAIDKYGIDYPVVQDNDFTIWKAYQGTSGGYWPAHFVFNATGEIRGYHRGEGAYAETEDLVRGLLIEAGHTDLPPRFEGSERSGGGGSGRTAEIYVGYGRNGCGINGPGEKCDLGNEEGYRPGQDIDYFADGAQSKGQVYLDGTWHNGAEAMTATSNGTVYLLFRAGAANFVVDGPMGECVSVSLDGAPIREDQAGVDVTFTQDGPCVILEETPRSYDFYAGPFEDRLVRFDVPSGFGLYTFAFSNEAMQ